MDVRSRIAYELPRVNRTKTYHLKAGIGRRARDEKQYFIVTERDGKELMASLVSSKKAPAPLKDDANRKCFMKVLDLCRHPSLTQVWSHYVQYLTSEYFSFVSIQRDANDE